MSHTMPTAYTLRQVAEMIPASEVTIRKRMKEKPRSLPPFEQPAKWADWQFPAKAFHEWLRRREAVRRATGKLYLRFIDTDRDNPFEAAVEVAEEAPLALASDQLDAEWGLAIMRDLVARGIAEAEAQKWALEIVQDAQLSRHAEDK